MRSQTLIGGAATRTGFIGSFRGSTNGHLTSRGIGDRGRCLLLMGGRRCLLKPHWIGVACHTVLGAPSFAGMLVGESPHAHDEITIGSCRGISRDPCDSGFPSVERQALNAEPMTMFCLRDPTMRDSPGLGDIASVGQVRRGLPSAASGRG